MWTLYGGNASSQYVSDPNGFGDYQGFYNGMLFGPGADVQLVQIDGLRDTTNVRQGNIARPRLDGTAAGWNTLDERVLTLTLAVFAPTGSFESTIAAIATAFQPSSSPTSAQPLQFQLPEWASPRQVFGRVTKGAVPIDTDFQFNVARKIAIELTCTDPLIYDTVTQTQSVGLPSPTAGLTFPASAPFVFGASTGGQMTLTNNGNYPTSFVATITGPMTNPKMTIGNQTLGFNIILGSSDSLVVDTGKRTATLNGTAPRVNTLLTGSSWLTLAPGVNTLQVASSDSAQVTGQFGVSFQSAWGFM